MSVLIKGMEMPKSCYSCNFCQYYAEPNQGCYCIALFVDLHRTDFVKERLPNCPLIEIKPHGRLIDSYALEDELGHFCEDYRVFNTVWHAPTIIEAEVEE